MKKLLIVVLCGMMLVGCGSDGISQEEYESVVAERDAFKAEKESMESEAASLSEELASVESEYATYKESAEAEYAAYKESMSEYEGLAQAEAEARLIEAERIAAEEQAAREQAEAESRAAKEAKEKMGYETGITYEQLARTPDDYEGEKIKFRGKVVQVIEGDDVVQIRLAVNSNYDTILFGEYDKDIVTSRVLEDDIITIYGTSVGVISYESTLGGTITIPGAVIEKIEQ